MRGRSRKTIGPRILTMPERSVSGFHRPSRHRVHQVRCTVRCSASRMKGVSCIPLRTACEVDIGTIEGGGVWGVGQR